ncbi:MAG: hypothetical protein MI920_13755 [Kiloniellales bacterium]|nr:hypothetical protein [Kiloniellales bacterium]
MTNLAIHFVDPTIPGLSGRDLVAGAIDVLHSVRIGFNDRRARERRDRLIRRDLAGLDRRLLRDVGLDQNAA